MNIRPAEASDLQQLFDLLKAKAEFDGCLESLQTTPASLRDALFSGSALGHALVADRGGRLVGMATYCAIFSSFTARPGLWLDDLFVVADCRGAGIGRRLMQALCVIARRGGCARVDWHVSAANQRGIHFYHGLGADISDKARRVRLDATGIESLAIDCLETAAR